MSIDKIKEYYAKERGFESWSEFLNNIHGFQIPSHMTEVAQRYAQSQAQELQEQNAELVFVLQNIANMLEVNAKISVESIKRVLTKYNHLKSNINGKL